MMTEKNIIEFGGLDPQNIDSADYTNTLAAEALRVGLYTDADIDRIRLGLINTLAAVIEYYSGGESTSVRMDKANDFMACIQFNCDTYLKTLGDHKTAAEMLRDVRTEELYNRGYARNKELVEECRRVFENVKYTRLSEAPASYYRAIDVQIPHYLDNYDPRFNAQDKLYVTIAAYDIKGPFRISNVLVMLHKLLRVNKGKKSDIEL